MAKRSETLSGMAVGSACSVPWDAMQGDGAERFCAECRRRVFDVAQMTPTEIHQRLAASRGQLCVRLTRRDGRLVTASEMDVPPPVALAPLRRAPALAAGLMAVWLGAGASGAEAGAGAAPAVIDPPTRQVERESAPARQRAVPTAGLAGQVTDAAGAPLPGVLVLARNTLDGRETRVAVASDGGFSIAPLPPGLYEVEATRQGFSITPQKVALPAGEQRRLELAAEPALESVLTGALISEPEPLRRQYDASDLVAVAVAGPTRVVGRKNGLLEAVTDLRIEGEVKGVAPTGNVAYWHFEVDPGERAPAPWQAELAPGTRVLAFLQRSAKDRGAGAPSFESARPWEALKRLERVALAAYLDRLDALAQMERRAAERGEEDAADLVEWLVATATDPHTRGEAAGELLADRRALADYAGKADVSIENASADLLGILDEFEAAGGRLRHDPPAELLGATLDAGQEKRLSAALRGAKDRETGAPALFVLVRTFDERTAIDWLVDQLRSESHDAAEDEERLWSLIGLAAEVKEDGVQEIVASSIGRLEAIDALWPGDDSPATEALRRERRAELGRELRRDLLARLTSER